MTGTLINTLAILLGGGLGLLIGSRIDERMSRIVTQTVGVFVIGLGLQLFFDTQNSLLVLGSLLIGGILGELFRLEEGLQSLGAELEQRFNRADDSNRFISGFLSASLLFVIGPMAILGSIQDGLTGNPDTLIIKAVMDGFTAMAFATSLGPGVLFSAIPVLLYQGSISLLAVQLNNQFSNAMIQELNATGGIILLALGISSLLEIKKIRVASLLPALVIAPLLAHFLLK